jgi:hypothetical protein
MNAQELANVLQKIKADPVLQETLRFTKQDWVELNLTTQETFWGINLWSENSNEISDYEIENVASHEFSALIVCTGTIARCCSRKCESVKLLRCQN